MQTKVRSDFMWLDSTEVMKTAVEKTILFHSQLER